jgi:hypothetical protein
MALKKSAVKKCKYEWVLIVDADERIPKETRHEIMKILSSPDSADAYSFPRKNFFHNKWIKHSGWWPDRVIRLFKKNKGRIDNSLVHESVEVNGIIKNLNTPIIHYSYSNKGFNFRVRKDRCLFVTGSGKSSSERKTIVGF